MKLVDMIKEASDSESLMVTSVCTTVAIIVGNIFIILLNLVYIFGSPAERLAEFKPSLLYYENAIELINLIYITFFCINIVLIFLWARYFPPSKNNLSFIKRTTMWTVFGYFGFNAVPFTSAVIWATGFSIYKTVLLIKRYIAVPCLEAFVAFIVQTKSNLDDFATSSYKKLNKHYDD